MACGWVLEVHLDELALAIQAPEVPGLLDVFRHALRVGEQHQLAAKRRPGPSESGAPLQIQIRKAPRVRAVHTEADGFSILSDQERSGVFGRVAAPVLHPALEIGHIVLGHDRLLDGLEGLGGACVAVVADEGGDGQRHWRHFYQAVVHAQNLHRLDRMFLGGPQEEDARRFRHSEADLEAQESRRKAPTRRRRVSLSLPWSC
eukprot:scaffold7624_cov248-Pinguiococcus_pyrenoidosus.AAC.19